MRTTIRTAVATLLIGALSAPAFAQGPETDTPAPGIRQVLAETRAGSEMSVARQFESGSSSGRALMWTGAALFVGGMGVGIFNFLNNQNGEYPEFGEATASNKKLGALGISTAFAGGALMAIGYKISPHSPDIQVGVDRFSVSKQLSW